MHSAQPNPSFPDKENAQKNKAEHYVQFFWEVSFIDFHCRLKCAKQRIDPKPWEITLKKPTLEPCAMVNKSNFNLTEMLCMYEP